MKGIASKVSFFREVKEELDKVVWPKREQVIKLTGILVIISIVVATYVGGLDYTFTKLLEALLAS